MFHRLRGLLSGLAVAAWLSGCASQHAGHPHADAAPSEHDATTPTPDAGEQAQDAAGDADVMVAPDAAHGPDAASAITCQLCLDYANGPSLYVHNSRDQTCTVLRMVWEFGCGGLNIGRSELCLEAAELWNHAEACPVVDAGAPFTAESAQGYVVGHEGIIGIEVQLAFPEEAGVRNVPVDFAACKPDYEETRPPCP